jgi:hypothetical protein
VVTHGAGGPAHRCPHDDPSIPLVVLGAVLIVAGLGLILLGRFRERRVHA